MGNRQRLLLENACYHLISRGNQKQNIFMDKQDYLVYLNLLKRFKRKYKFRLYAYCLMPNHVHLLGEIANTPFLSKFMHDLNRTYTLYFNRQHVKVGHLWQGRFKSKIITKDRYLFDCITYIELNPLRAKLVNNASDYSWTSYNARVFDKIDGVLDDINKADII